MKDITYVYLLIIIIYITYFTMYENEYETKIKRDKQLKVRYKSTTEYPSIQRRDSDIVYYSKYGDTYSNLAYRF